LIVSRGKRFFFLLRSFQASSEAYPAPYAMGTRDFKLMTIHLQLVPRLKNGGAIYYSTIHLHGTVQG
jgi:hypothetical protein